MRARKWIPLAAGATVFSMASWGFGGEDVAQGHPWHHEDITERALTGADALYADPPVEFTASAAASITVAQSQIEICEAATELVGWALGVQRVACNECLRVFQRSTGKTSIGRPTLPTVP